MHAHTHIAREKQYVAWYILHVRCTDRAKLNRFEKLTLRYSWSARCHAPIFFSFFFLFFRLFYLIVNLGVTILNIKIMDGG